MTSNLIDVARRYFDAGLVVLPANRLQKRPVIAWKRFVSEFPTFDEIFNGSVDFDALAVVCGAVSGGLEIIDFDQKAKSFDAWKNVVASKFGDNSRLFDLVVETSQSGGKHVAFRSDACFKNMKLASDSNGVLIETRGGGGICIVAPTPGYDVQSGDWLNVPKIGIHEREMLLTVARSFDQTAKQQPTLIPPKRPSSFPTSTQSTFNGESVSDMLRRDLSFVRETLRKHGWTYLRNDGDFEQYARPNQNVAGKMGGSLHVKESFFYCFTTNAPPLDVNRCYSPLALIAALDFNGDESAASKHFASMCPSSFSRRRSINIYNDDSEFEPERASRSEPTKSDQIKTDAVEFPENVLNCGGLINEFSDVANQYAIRAQPEGAFLAGLASMSFLAGRSFALNYAGTLVTPNLYALFLAPSGMGKEILRRVCSAVATAYNPDESVPESFASVQALQNMTSRLKKIFWLHDEFGRDLSVMAGKTVNVNISGIITESLKLYSNANNRNYLPKLIASEAKGAKRPEPVDRPSLTIFATGNPTEFYEATTETVLRNGYVSRFSIVYGRRYSEKKRTSFVDAQSAQPMRLTKSIIARIQQWRNLENALSNPHVATFNEQAFDVVTAYDDDVERQIKIDVLNSDGLTEMKARLFEKIWKYALLFALSKYGIRPDLVVDRESAELAVSLVDYESRLFAKNAQRFAASAVSALASEIVEFVKTNGGSASLSQITRKFQRREKRQRDEALLTLIDAEYLRTYDDHGKRYFTTDEI